MIELQKKTLEGDTKLEAIERVKMGQEDSNSKTHGVGENLRTIPVPESSVLSCDRTRHRLLSGDNFQQPSLRGGACNVPGKQFAWEVLSQKDPTNAM